MKTIIYALVAILIVGSIATGFTNKANPKIILLIQSADSNISLDALSQSAQIISNRLKDFSSDKPDVTMISEKKQIQVNLNEGQDITLLENLLTHKGSLGFFETYNRGNITELLKGDTRLYSLFDESDTSNSAVRIGCTSETAAEKVNDYLRSLRLRQRCRFAWSQSFGNADLCLYALRLGEEKDALLTGADVESMKFTHENDPHLNVIQIKFRKPAIGIWAEATHRNIGKAIAIVLDDQVLSAPVVRSEIQGGNCSITGNFSIDEARYIVALGNNGELPVNFTVVK